MTNAKKTVLFVGNSGSEINSIAEREKIPQAIKLERRSIGAHKSLNEIARDQIVIIGSAARGQISTFNLRDGLGYRSGIDPK
jgi:hypothetical protein